MFIQTEDTPNPATVKFLPGQNVMPRGNAEFRGPDEAQASPLAQRLFTLQGVVSVFLGSDFVSITKSGDTDWSMLKPMVLAALMEHLSTGQPIIDEDKMTALNGDASGTLEDGDEITAQIKELLDTRVRPQVAMDGGDIEFDRFEDGVVFLSMRGACAGCPSATMTLKAGIENMLRHFIPEVTEVRPAEEY